MPEFVFDDGRKAEKVENNVDSMTKVTEVYVEPKQEKKLAQRITERLCVCEREIESLDEVTGEVVNRVVERICEGRVMESNKSGIVEAVEKRISEKKKIGTYVFIAIVAAQIAVLAYVMFGM